MKARRQNTFRIIGGIHRGRRFRFPDGIAIRPSPDRVRETVFNWLQPVIAGARCLDLFAGSGALGLEALSRGAARVEFVDRSAAAAASIRQHLGALRDEAKSCVSVADALSFLRVRPPEPFDVVFLDPPFRAGLVEPACTALEANGWLAPEARIYLESAADEGAPALPENWTLLREKTAGQVAYRLALRD